MSENHPDLRNSAGPSTMKAHLAKVEAKTNRKTASLQVHTDKIESSDEETEVNEKTKFRQGKGKKRLRAFDVAEICVAKSIKTRSDLLALAHEQKVEGKTDLAEFIINRGDKIVDSIITTAWEMENATEQKTRLETSRLDSLRKAGDGKCICNVENEWLETATSLLQENHISPDHFANCVRLLLEKGRGKYRNIMLTGPANCGKTFLLNPLNVVFKTFTNPASTSFAWVGAETAEVIFLNDFRWSQQIIAWHDLLLMLEGQLVHLPAPKSHYAKDIVFNLDTPVFCTTKHPIVLVRSGHVDERETEMMSVRWRIFAFNYQIPLEHQKDIVPCPTCFCRLILR